MSKIETKRCGACHEEKSMAQYSKKQWLGKAKRRCQDCLDAGRTIEARAPPPIAKTLCWDLYYMLQGGASSACGDAATKRAAYLRATAGLTEDEIQVTHFADPEAACMAVMRGMALLDTQGGNDCRSAAFLLIARAMLWLARDAQRVAPLPAGAYGKPFEDRESLQKSLQAYLAALKSLPACKPLALCHYAFACARCVACEEGHSARPNWPEAWLVRAECELLLGELRCCARGRGAAAKRPADRLGPWAAAGDDALAWEVDVPGHPAQPLGAKTFLGDHWWGLDAAAARDALTRHLLPAVRSLELLAGVEANDPETRADKARRRDLAERGLYRRGAACVAALGAADDGADEKFGKLVDDFRRVFPGSPFDASVHFLKRLPLEPHADSAWRLDAAGGALRVVDVGADSPHAGATLVATPVAKGAVIDADALYAAARDAMAGAGAELRATGGPPRVPKTLEVAAPYDAHVAALNEKLAGLGVTATGPRAGGAATRGRKAMARAAPDAAALAVGKTVTIAGLASKPEHNGKRAEIVRWLADKARWEVALVPEAGDAKAALLSLKPNNLELA